MNHPIQSLILGLLALGMAAALIVELTKLI